MNIYDLEKQATPGPWKAVSVEVDYDCGRGWSDTIRADIYCTGSKQMFKDALVADLKASGSVNAKLISHCRNNFMKALEALKLVSDRGFDWEARERVKSAIKELETV